MEQLATGILPVLPVTDVSKTLAWYVDTLGFDKLFEHPQSDGTVFTAQVEKHGSHIMFNLNPADAGSRGGGIYLWIRIQDDLEAFYKKLVAEGLEVVDQLQDGFWGDQFFSVRDLNGYILAFNKAKA
ncbi:MAG: glyoxalase superfamily protein [Deinococcota bacterium]